MTALRYTRRPVPIYTGHACRHLPRAVPWISEDRLLSESWCSLWFLLVAMYPFHSHSSLRCIVLETLPLLSPQELKLKNACEFPMLVLPPLRVWLCGDWVWTNRVLIPLPNQSLLWQMWYQCQDAWTAIDTFVPTPEINFIQGTTERSNSCPLHCVFWSRLMYDEISLFIPANTAWKESDVCVCGQTCLFVHDCELLFLII